MIGHTQRLTARKEDAAMAATDEDLQDLLVAERELWCDGPPHQLLQRLRAECPLHWSERISDVPDSAGFWSVTTADDVHAVSRDWRTYSSELGGITASNAVFPLHLTRSMFIGMDPPQHDRVKALFQAGFTPKRIADHEDRIRAIVAGVLQRLDARHTCDLVSDVAQPVVSRVIGSFMGVPPQEDADWARLINAILAAADPDLNPDGIEVGAERNLAELFQRCRRLIDQRRQHPTDDLTSVLVHSEVDGQRLAEHEIVMGFFLLMAAGNDSTKATYCSGMRALIENPHQRQLLLDDPSLIPGAVEESLRMFPAFSHFRRTATCDTELNGHRIKAGEKVVLWYVSSNRDESRYPHPHRFDVRRNPDHQAFGAGGRHFCLGTALARLELRILFQESLRRYPSMELAGTPSMVESTFVNQLKTLPVKLGAQAPGAP
jgi:cytochrome P450